MAKKRLFEVSASKVGEDNSPIELPKTYYISKKLLPAKEVTKKLARAHNTDKDKIIDLKLEPIETL